MATSGCLNKERPRGNPGGLKPEGKGGLVHCHDARHIDAVRGTASPIPHATSRCVVAAVEIIGTRCGEGVGLVALRIAINTGIGTSVEIKGMEAGAWQVDGVANMGRENKDIAAVIGAACRPVNIACPARTCGNVDSLGRGRGGRGDGSGRCVRDCGARRGSRRQGGSRRGPAGDRRGRKSCC